jgi:ABC-type branched-subunit amino acid transport system substrate-binding protein
MRFSKRLGLFLLPFILLGCALIPAKKEVAVEAPPSAEEKQARQQLAKAESALQEGDLEGAALQYRQLVMAFPRSPQAAKALLRQGEIDFRLEHYEQGASVFQQVIDEFPVRPEGDEARIWLLRCYLQLERFNDAVETGRSLTNYLPKKSQKATAAEIVGDAQEAQQKYAEAVRWYVKAYELAGEEVDAALTEKIDAALENLDRELVLALLAEYSEGFPNLRLQTRLVGVDMEKGHLGTAQQQLLALIEEQPQHPLAETWKEMAEKIEEWLKVDMTTVGCVLPISGRYKDYGDRVLRGLLMAAQDLQSQSAIGGEIQLIIKDSGSDPATAVAAVRDLVLDQRVAAIIGPLSRVAAEAAAEEAQNLWIPIITLTQKQGVNNIGPFVFRSFLSNEQQTRALVEYAVLGLGYRRFAMLSPNDSYGTRLVQLFWDELDRLGAEVRGVEFYDPSQTDFADQIKKLVGLYYPRPESEITEKSKKVMDTRNMQEDSDVAAPEELTEEEPLPIVDFEAVFIPDSYSQVGLIAPQFAYYDVTGIKMLGTNLWNSPKLMEMAAPYLQGSVFVDGFFAGSSMPLTNQFVLRYKQFYGENPGYPEALAYDTLRLLAKALNQPGVTSRPLLRDALLAIRDLPGVAGTASVDQEGEVHKPPFLIGVYRRQMEEVLVDFGVLRQRQKSMEFFGKDQRSHLPIQSSPSPETVLSTVNQ